MIKTEYRCWYCGKPLEEIPHPYQDGNTIGEWEIGEGDAKYCLDGDCFRLGEYGVSDSPTPAQLAYITKIADVLNKPFTGITKASATKYISDNHKEFEAEVWLERAYDDMDYDPEFN